jgi:hypothetical protein
VDRRGRVGAEVAGQCPEVAEVGRVDHLDRGVQHAERVHAHRLPAEPGPRREAHPGHLGQRAELLVGEVERVRVASDVVRIHDLRELVTQDPHGVHPYREHVRHRHRTAQDVRVEPVPDTLGVLRRPHGPVGEIGPTEDFKTSALSKLAQNSPGPRPRGATGSARLHNPK